MPDNKTEEQDPKQENPQEEEKNTQPSEQTESKQDSTKVEQSTKQVENQEDLPEKFQGKSSSEIAKSYLELEKKLGQYSQTQKELEEWRALGQVIKNDPELVKALESKVATQQKSDEGKANGQPKDDTRSAVSNNIVNQFEKEKGLDQLEPDKRKDMHQRIGNELADMLDPGGNKSTREILESINLSKLPQYLDKAYRLATMNDQAEQERLKGLAQARQNSEAEFGSMRASSGKSEKKSLTPEEEATAKKLGITPEKYLEQKKKLE